jgi:hypothetical protein
MKPFLVLCLLALSALPLLADEPSLPAGQYLLISDVKEGISVQKCEIKSDKDGATITFPDAALKPVRIFMSGNSFQFSVGPGDYDQATDKTHWDVTTYRGQMANDVPKGDVSEDAVTRTRFGKFLLYKQ